MSSRKSREGAGSRPDAVLLEKKPKKSGRDIQGQGITPDKILDGPEPLNPGGEGDRWLRDAERTLQLLIDQEASQVAEESPAPTLDHMDEEQS